jgi:hypothetical protein
VTIVNDDCTIIVQASLTIVTYDRQNIFIIQATDLFQPLFLSFRGSGQCEKTHRELSMFDPIFEAITRKLGNVLSYNLSRMTFEDANVDSSYLYGKGEKEFLSLMKMLAKTNVSEVTAFLITFDFRSWRLSVPIVGIKMHYDTQPNDIQPNDIQPNDIQPNNIQPNDTQPNDIQHNDTQHNI